MTKDPFPLYDDPITFSGRLDNPSLHFGGTPSSPGQPSYLARVPEIAARLGVEPLKSPHPSTFVLHIGGGVEYDLFALISAFLDKVDTATKP